MEVHEISFYSQFHCTMSDCPATCCRGWQIVFDDDTYAKYMREPGLAGLRLRSGITRRNGMTMFRHRRGKCPFLTKERTCGVQISLGEDYMPDVCRIFPRQRVNYGAFAEETLFLACPEVARLFLHNLDKLCFHTVEKAIGYGRLGTNDDPDFLQELVSLRGQLVTQIADTRIPRANLYAGLLTYADRLQQYYIQNPQLALTRKDKSAQTNEDIVLPGDTIGPNRAVPPSLIECIRDAQPYFHISAEMLDRMMTGGFYHVFLKATSPFLYRLCRMYFKEFDQLTPAQAEARTEELMAGLTNTMPETEQLLRGHLIYYILLEFLTTYENYSFLRVIATGIMHTHFLELLLALYYEKNHSLTENEIIQIIAVYDRRGRHCAEVEAGMYDVIAPYLLQK